MEKTVEVAPRRRVRELRSPEILAHPFEAWENLRAAREGATIDGCPAAASREDVMEIFSNPEDFKSGGSKDLGSSRRLIPQEIDPPDHKRYRKLMDPLFAPREVRLMEPAIRAIAIELIESVLAAGSCDFTTTVGQLAPRFFAIELLELPESGFNEMLYLKGEVIHPTGATDGERQASRIAAGMRIEKMLDDARRKRMANPGDDLLSRVINMRVEGDSLTPDEVLAMYYMFFVAGLDTVAGMMSCMFAFLASSPKHRRRIVDDPGVIPKAVEEMLRRETVIENVTRVASRDCEFNGRAVRAGDPVVVAMGAANHDPSVFANPETVDFDRDANKHLAFAAGIHRCLGSHLARLELAIVLEEWHKKIPDYWLAEGTELRWLDSPVRTVRHLPLEWDVSSTCQ
jgi:cytochrome P450